MHKNRHKSRNQHYVQSHPTQASATRRRTLKYRKLERKYLYRMHVSLGSQLDKIIPKKINYQYWIEKNMFFFNYY